MESKFWLVKQVAQEFSLEGDIVHIEENSNGHINQTFILETTDQEKSSLRRYVLQRINSNIFKDPVLVMENIDKVTRHMQRKIKMLQQGSRGSEISEDRVLRLISLKHDEDMNYVRNVHGDCGTWRCYNFIEGCVSYNIVESFTQAYTVAHAFGTFQELLCDISIESIHETIPDFHNTTKRYQNLLEVVRSDSFHRRVKSVTSEISFVKAREHVLSTLTDLSKNGKIPIRLTHNDTKINNILIHKDTDKAVCVIDLDTVMPGLSLYDFGDLVRTVVSPSKEDEIDLNMVEFRMEMFEALVDGYMDACPSLWEEEIRYLAFSGILMTLEVGIRFLTDYVQGDVYFRTARPLHNLDRARTQFRLVELLEDNRPRMEECIQQKMKSKS